MKAVGVSVACVALLVACATGKKEVRDPAGGDVWSGMKWVGKKVKKAFVHDKNALNPDAAAFRATQYGDINTIDTSSPEAMAPPPPMEAPPPPQGGSLGPQEDVIPQQIARMKAQRSFFDTTDHARFPGNGGRVQISADPGVAGFWQMPPLPQDFINVRGPDGRERPVPMKMGAIQASVLPSGKVLMVSGSSNRGDSRPTKNPPVTSQAYGFIDNTELFDPSLVPLIPDDLTNVRLDLASLEYPTIEGTKLNAPARPLAQEKRGTEEFLYQRPASLPPEQAFTSFPIAPEVGTLRDPKFCAAERPPGTKLFNNGISILADAAQYCAKIADPSLRGGVGVALPLVENGQPDPVEPNIDLFCGGHHPLPNGNVLFAGGTRKAVSFTEDFTPIPFHGVKRTMIFDWRLQQWRDAGKTRGPLNMGDGRWYPTLVELPDGKLFIIGGMNHRGEISHTLEVYDPKTLAMSSLVDFRPLGGRPMPNEPFSVLDPVAGRRFDNFPRVFLTHQSPALPGCADQLHCVRLLITGDGSAEGNRDAGMNNTVYVDIDTRAFPRLVVNFVRGPQRNQAAQGRPKTHDYTTHLYPTQLFDPLTESGDYLILGGSVNKYDPLHVAQDVKQNDKGEKVVNADTSTFFNSKPDQRTVSDMERFNGASGSFEPVFEHFLGDDGDVTSKVGTSRLFPASRWDTVPCDPHDVKAGKNICGPLNRSGMINPNAVLLPTRQFLVLGGGNHSYADPIFNPVLFTPTVDPFVHPSAGGRPVGWRGEWTRNFMNPFHLPRLYHNTALLLPDGRVFMGSGNTFISFLKGVDGFGLPIVGPFGGQANNYNNFEGAEAISGVFRQFADPANPANRVSLSNLSVDLPAEQYQVELFNPPYLFFPGPRPVIQGIQVKGRTTEFHALPPGKRWIDPEHEDILGYGTELALAIKQVADGARGRVTMIRLGGVTHAINFSQKLHTLHTPVGGRVDTRDGGIVVARAARVGETAVVTVQAPASPRVAPPGYYMLFFVNDRGKPSEARVVRLCNQVSTPAGVVCAEDPA
jgi:hypothetical protein